MSTQISRTDDAHAGRPAGYVLLSVLIAAGIMASFVAAYGRHVVVQARGSMTSPSLLGAREACHSGLQYARQALVAGEAVAAGSVATEACTATFDIVDLTGGRQQLQVQAVRPDGMGVQRTAVLALQATANSQPAGPASLPTLDAQTVADLLADTSVPRADYNGAQRIEGASLTGLLVLHPGAQLELADVVLHGSIVSAAVLGEDGLGAFDAANAPRVVVDGNVRIDPHASLPGVAILLPDGAVEGSSADARIQIHGDVVAHDVTLLQAGALEGNVSAVQLQLAGESQLDRLGHDRKSAAWSPTLQLGGTHEPVYLAVVPATSSAEQLATIIQYWQED